MAQLHIASIEMVEMPRGRGGGGLNWLVKRYVDF